MIYLNKYLENCENERIEAIYNREYRYIKEIIWDDEKNEKFGTTRKGYDDFSKTNKGSVSYSGEIDLRVNVDTNKKEILGYITETKLSSNEKMDFIFKNYEEAKKEMIKILEVKDIKSFDYWFNNSHSTYMNGANEIINSIKVLDSIIVDYYEDEEFKMFLDKIKNI